MTGQPILPAVASVEPLSREWDTITSQAKPLFGVFDAGLSIPAEQDNSSANLQGALRDLVAPGVPVLPTASLDPAVYKHDHAVPNTASLNNQRVTIQDIPDVDDAIYSATLPDGCDHILEEDEDTQSDASSDIASNAGDPVDDPYADLEFNDMRTAEGRARAALNEGCLRQAPSIELALSALEAILDFLYPSRRNRRGDKIAGHINIDRDPFTRIRLEGMQSMLSFYTNRLSKTYGHWAASSIQAAVSHSKGLYTARVYRTLVRAYIADREILPVNPYGSWNTTMLADENVTTDVLNFLQSLGDEITAEKLMNLLNEPEFRVRHGITKMSSLRTAQRYLHILGYRFGSPKAGQYVDGHEREDVKEHREKQYVPDLVKV